MRFSKEWLPTESKAEKIIYRPVLEVRIVGIEGKRYRFIVDSGADISVAPRYICDRLKLVWHEGQQVEMRGIAKKEECIVAGRIHNVDVIIPDINLRINIPICYAEGDAPFLLGREGFMDYFDVHFTKKNKETVFTLIDKAQML